MQELSLSRRRLLAGLLATPGLFGKGASAMDRIGVITDEAAESPAEAIEFARRFGLRWLELRSVPRKGRGGPSYADLPVAELKETAKALRDAGLRVSFLNTGLCKTWLPGTDLVWNKPPRPELEAKIRQRGEEHFAQRRQLLDKAIEAAHILGVDKVRVFGFLRTTDPAAVAPRIADILGEMGEAARKGKVHLLVENETATNVATSAELADMLGRLPDPHFGINWDPMNGMAFGEKPFPDGYRLLPKERIGNVQIKGKTLLFAEDRLDWRTIMDTLTREGYKGQFGLETHIWDPPGVVAYSGRAMTEIQRLLGAS